VTRDVPPYAVVAGNPARLLRMRFQQAVVDGLLDSRWWEFDEAELCRLAVHIRDPETFLKHLRK
jgi:virginiamycin A acetyltransferase